MEPFRSVIFVFLDGVGLGPADESNPFWSAGTPTLRRLLGGPLVNGVRAQRLIGTLPVLCRGIDATLGVPGLPQSGTGQTALFTGINAVEKIAFRKRDPAAVAGHELIDDGRRQIGSPVAGQPGEIRGRVLGRRGEAVLIDQHVVTVDVLQQFHQLVHVPASAVPLRSVK